MSFYNSGILVACAILEQRRKKLLFLKGAFVEMFGIICAQVLTKVNVILEFPGLPCTKVSNKSSKGSDFI